MDVCRSCKTPLRWAVTEAGRRIPLDAAPAEDGSIVLSPPRPGGELPLAAVLPEARRAAYAGALYRTHFATCPDADEHRKRGQR